MFTLPNGKPIDLDMLEMTIASMIVGCKHDINGVLRA